MKKRSLYILALISSIVYLNDLRSQSLPDLSISNIASNDLIFQPGRQISITYTVSNTGTANSSFSYSACYLSADAVKDNSDILLKYDYAGPVKAGDSTHYNYQAIFTIPSSTAYGNYYLLVMADFNGMIQELSETNNVAPFPFPIGPINADLIMKPVSVSPSSILAEQIKYVSFELKNKGLSTVMTDYLCVLSADTTWSKDDPGLFTNPVNYWLRPNDSVAVNLGITVPANTSPGSYYLLYIVDFANSVDETNESNNIVRFPVSVISQSAGLPDLDVLSEQVTPSTVSGGENCLLSFDIANLEPNDVPQGVTDVFFYISKDTLYDEADVGFYAYQSSSAIYVPVDSSIVHASAVKTIPSTVAPGNYYMLMIADQYNSIRETNNANNIGYYPITIAPPGTSSPFADVKILSASATGGLWAPGRYITLAAQVYIPNYSSGAANYIRYILSSDTISDNNDIIMGSEYVSAFAPDTAFITTKKQLPAGLAAGPWYVIFDMGSTVNDPDAYNNRKFVAVTITPPAYDLKLIPGAISSSVLSPSSRVQLSLKGINCGPGIPQTVQLAFYLSDDSILDGGDLYFSDVDYPPYLNFYYYAEDTLETEVYKFIPSTTGYGTKYMLCKIDYGNTTPEVNENNNMCFFPINIVPPDVDLGFFSPSPIIHTIDFPNYLQWEENIVNAGSTPSPPTYISYYLSADSLFDSSDQYVSSRLLPTINGNDNLNTMWSQWVGNVLPAGDFYLLSYLDKYNNLPETDETNNIAFTKFKQPPPPAIELRLNPCVLYRNTGTINEGVRLTVSLYNDGATGTGNVKIGYYLSTDSVYSPNDQMLKETTIYNTYPGGSSILSEEFGFPTGTVTGNYFILAVADPQNQVPENNENNNRNFAAYTILPTTIDFAINTPQVVPGSILSGHSVYMCYNIEKTGNNILNFFPQISFLLSSDTLASNDDVNLGQGSYYQSTVVVPSATATGNYYIIFCVDPTNYVIETNEGNNKAWTPVSVQQLPTDIDLMIGSATAAGYAHAGDVVGFTCSVDNIGTTPVYTKIETGLYLSADSIWGQADVFMPMGYNNYPPATSMQIPPATLPGNYYIIFFTDYKSAYGETNEFNNTKAIPIRILQSDVDLSVQQPVVSSGTFTTNDRFEISFVIKNSGDSASPVFSTTCYLSKDSVFGYSDDRVGAVYPTSLHGHDSAAATITIYLGDQIEPGSYYLLIIADQFDYNGSPKNSVPESNENNNALAVPIIIKRAAIDLTFQGLRSPFATAIAGAPLPIEYKAVNLGNSRSPQVYMKSYLSKDSILSSNDVVLGDNWANINPIDGNSYINKNTSPSIWVSGSGVYYIILQADNYNSCTEINEKNNIVWYPVSVVNPGEDTTMTNVDLVIQSASVPATVVAGSQLTITSSVYNIGQSTAANVRMEYSLSTDSVYDSWDANLNSSFLSSIVPSGYLTNSDQLYISASKDTGLYYLHLQVDCDNAYDKNWKDNQRSVPFHVIKPADQIADLSIAGNLSTGGIIYPGSIAGFMSSVKNLGSDSINYIASYFLSEDLYLDNYDQKLATDHYGFLPPFDSVNIQPSLLFPMTTEAGNYFIIASVRTYFPVADSDSTNNVLFIPITVSPSDNDLSVPSVVMSADTISIYNTSAATTSVLNSGLSTSHPALMAYYLSADGQLSSDDIWFKSEPLKPILTMDDTTLSAMIFLPSYVTAGDYYLLNYADYLCQVPETDEYNNINSVGVNVTVGLSENGHTASHMIIYPNPSRGKVNLLLDGNKKGNGEIYIINTLGVLVLTESVRGDHISFDMENMPKGVYMLRYVSDGIAYTGKVVIQ